jgi:HEAT repeat protein
MFCAVLPALAQTRDPATARHLLEIMLDPTFEGRSADEKRAVYSALAGAGGDELLPDLELELHKGNWFSRGNESHRQAMARCIARIGTPAARAMLEEGARSRRGPVRKVCEEALARMNSHE